MIETLVYDSARDGGGGLSMMKIATLCVVLGIVLMAVPTILMVLRQPEKRARGLATLGALAAIGAVVVLGLPMLDTVLASNTKPELIEGVVGAVSPKLITVGGMKIMVSCADTARCPALKIGENARVAYVEDSGPETDALATKIWRLSK